APTPAPASITWPPTSLQRWEPICHTRPPSLSTLRYWPEWIALSCSATKPKSNRSGPWLARSKPGLPMNPPNAALTASSGCAWSPTTSPPAPVAPRPNPPHPQSHSIPAPAPHLPAHTGQPSVLFVCVHNAGRSQMAAAYVRELGQGRIEVRSPGSEPADQLNPVAVEAMAEEGIDITAATPNILTPEAVKASDVVITMGCG